MMKLRQGQVWKHDEEYVRIVRLERLQVEYKSTTQLSNGKGTHHQISKKEFCRLLKNGVLLAPVDTPVLLSSDSPADKSRVNRPLAAARDFS